MVVALRTAAAVEAEVRIAAVIADPLRELTNPFPRAHFVVNRDAGLLV